MKLVRGPWIYVVLAFVALMIAWGTLISIATKNRVEAIPVKTSNH
jgi:hypothetical protein